MPHHHHPHAHFGPRRDEEFDQGEDHESRGQRNHPRGPREFKREHHRHDHSNERSSLQVIHDERLKNIELEEARVALQSAIGECQYTCPELNQVCGATEKIVDMWAGFTPDMFSNEFEFRLSDISSINPKSSSHISSSLGGNEIDPSTNDAFIQQLPEIDPFIGDEVFDYSRSQVDLSLGFPQDWDRFITVPDKPPSVGCIMEHAYSMNLSDQCQSSIFRLQYAADHLHDVMIHNDEFGHPHCGFFILPLLFVVLAPLIIFKIAHRHSKVRKARKILEAIQRDPQLKAAVEAASGETFPSHGYHNSSNGCLKISSKFIGGVFAVFSFLVLFAVFINTVRAYSTDVSGDSSQDIDSRDDGPLFTFDAFPIFLWWAILIAVFATIKAVRRSNNEAQSPLSPHVNIASAPPANSMPVIGRVSNWWNRSPTNQGYAPMTGTTNLNLSDDELNARLYEPPRVQGPTNIA